jgi:hypothetical protein
MPRDVVGSGKGDDRRPCLVSREENDLRWRLAFDMTEPNVREGINRRIKVLVAERTHCASE